MNSIQSESNNNNDNPSRIYNCAGKNCTNTPSHYIKLVLIKKSGFFCESCANYLKDNALIESVLDVKV